MNQKVLINKISKCVLGLTNIIESENEALRVGKISSISSIIEKKMASLQEFDQLQYEVEDFICVTKVEKDDPALLKLKTLFMKLNAVNYENDILLKTNIEVSHMLIESYKMSKKENALNKVGYNNRGQKIALSNLEKIMPPMSLNNKI